MTNEQIYAAANEIEGTMRGFMGTAIDQFTDVPTERGLILMAVLTLSLRRYLTAFKATPAQRADALAKIETAVMQP